VTTTTDTRQGLPTGIWKVDPVHSEAGFAVEYIAGAFKGTVSPVDVKLEVGEGGARLTGSAPVSGIRVKDENLSAHLQSPEFFDAERAPEITFASTEIRRSAGDIEIDGELAIKGISLPVKLRGKVTDPVDDPYGGVRFGLKLETTVDRTDFGMKWNNPMPDGRPSLADEVRLSADLFLVKE
jgi:polyisoprenoid-binding protein YceI